MQIFFSTADGGTLYFMLYMHEAENEKLPEQKCWSATVGVVFDYVAVQSKAVMLLSHLDRISSGGNTCSCVCRVQSRHGNLDFIKEMGKEKGEKWVFVASVRLRLWCVHVRFFLPVLVRTDAYHFCVFSYNTPVSV